MGRDELKSIMVSPALMTPWPGRCPNDVPKEKRSSAKKPCVSRPRAADHHKLRRKASL